MLPYINAADSNGGFIQRYFFPVIFFFVLVVFTMETDFKSPGKEESSSLDERNHWSVLNNLLKSIK